MEKRYIDLTGQKFYRLLLKQHLFIEDQKGRKRSAYICECDCGNVKTILAQSIKPGIVRSCGCLNNEVLRTHGMTGTSEFIIWQGIRQRCQNPRQPGYASYGGRGIKVADRWEKFENFFSDMGPRPSKRHSVDRIDRNGDYSPENCRWATHEEQNYNRDVTVLVSAFGKKLTINELSERTGINRNTLRSRVRKGWPPERVISPTHASLCKVELAGRN